MNILKKLTSKNLKLNRKRSVVTVIGIILSVALIAALSTLAVSFWQSFIVAEKNMDGDFHVVLMNPDKDIIDRAKNNAKVEDSFFVSLEGIGYLEGSKNTSKPYIQVMSGDKKSLEGVYFNLVEGRYPENENEIVMSRHMGTNGRVKYNVGDTVTLELGRRVVDVPFWKEPDSDINESDLEFYSQYDTGCDLGVNLFFECFGTEKIVDAKPRTFTVVGIMERPSSYIEEYDSPAYSAITYSEQLNEGYVLGAVRLNKAGLKKWKQTVAGILGIPDDVYKKVFVQGNYTDDELETYIEQYPGINTNVNIRNGLIELECPFGEDPSLMMSQLIALCAFVALIIMLTSVYCIKNSFDISITEKTKQFGMLASIGATKKQIRKSVIYEGFLLALYGIPIGMFGGVGATYVLIKICNVLLADVFEFELVFEVSVIALIVALVLGILTIYLSALGSAIRASRVSPIAAIRNQQDVKVNSKKIKCPKLVSKIFGMGGVISYKNMKRNKRKYRTTIVSIVICVAVFIGISEFVKLGKTELDSVFTEIRYNLEVRIGGDVSEVNELVDELKKLDMYDDVYLNRDYPMMFSEIDYDDDYYKYGYENYGCASEEEFRAEASEGLEEMMMLYVIPDDQYLEYAKEAGQLMPNVNDGAIVMNYTKSYYRDGTKEKTAITEVYDIDAGDEVKAFDYKVDEDTEVTIKIACVTKERPVAIPSIWQNSTFYVSDSYWEKITGNSSLYKPDGYSLYFITDNADDLQDQVDSVVSEFVVNSEGWFFEVFNVDSEAKALKAVITVFSIFAYGLITVIALIGITNIVNTLNTSMELRAREFAMLRSVGMTTKQFNRMIRLETVFIGIKSMVFGLPLGGLFALGFYKITSTSMYIPFEYPVFASIVCIITVFLILSIIMRFALAKINKRNIIDTIKDETT